MKVFFVKVRNLYRGDHCVYSPRAAKILATQLVGSPDLCLRWTRECFDLILGII